MQTPGDDAWQLERLRAAAAEHGFEVRTTDCLGPCNQADVIVVVQPSPGRPPTRRRAAWIGFANDDDCTDDVLRWTADGDPATAKPPATLELQFIRPSRGARLRARR